MQMQMTITGDGSLSRWRSRAAAAALVITLLGSQAAMPAAGTASLTTSSPAPAALTTVIVEGSSIFGPPRLFGAYSAELGRPITREQASTIVEAIAALYVDEGYVKPE